MKELAEKVGAIVTEMETTPASDPVAVEYSGRACDHLKIARDLLEAGAADVAERKRVADEKAAADAAAAEAAKQEPEAKAD